MAASLSDVRCAGVMRVAALVYVCVFVCACVSEQMIKGVSGTQGTMRPYQVSSEGFVASTLCDVTHSA